MKIFILLALLPVFALADSQLSSSDSKVVAQAHVDFKIIIPQVIDASTGKTNSPSRTPLITSCDANNICTVSAP